MKKILLSVSGVLLLLILSGGGWLWLGAQIERNLTAELSRALDADVKISSVNTRLFAGQIQLVNGALASRDAGAPWSRASFAQASATLRLGDIFAAVIPLSVSIDGAEIELKPPGTAALPNPAAAVHDTLAAADRQSWPRVRLQNVSVKNLSLRNSADPAFSASGISANLELAPNQISHTGGVTAASLTAGGLALSNLALKFSGDAGQVRVENFHAAIGSGLVTGSAAIPRHGDAALHFELSRVPADVLLSAKWRVIISGLASGSGDYTGDLFQWRRGAARGALALEQAALKAPPFLQPVKQIIPALATLGDITLDTARADFQYTAGNFVFTNLSLAKNQVLALRGTAAVNQDLTVSGDLQLGIPNSTPLPLSKLKSEIFTVDADGYYWASVKLSGTPGDWQEDLTPRILQAIGGEAMQLLDKAKDGFDKAKQKAGELLDKFFGR